MKLLCINPGSTSTRVAVFCDTKIEWSTNVSHTNTELEKFNSIQQQLEYRYELISSVLRDNCIDLNTLDVVVGRGGALRPIEGGVYSISEVMLADCKKGTYSEHPSNLGCQLALLFSIPLKIPAFVVDPPLIDEFEEVARISGIPEITRTSAFHALNEKAVADLIGEKLSRKTVDLNIITAHLGSGISVTAQKKGRCVDNNFGTGGDGPFSPERCGRLPALALIEEILKNEKLETEIWKKSFSKKSGIVSYLGTNDILALQKRIDDGERYVKDILDGMVHLIAKEIAAYCTIMNWEVDAIGITGAIARSSYTTGRLRDELDFIAPVIIFPGELEMEALARGARKAVLGELKVKSY